MPFADVASTAAAYARTRAACEAAGRDPASLLLSHAITVCCASTDAEVDHKIERLDFGPLRETGAAGTPEQVADRLRAYAELGAQRTYLQFPDLTDLDQLDLIATEVRPLVADV